MRSVVFHCNRDGGVRFRCKAEIGPAPAQRGPSEITRTGVPGKRRDIAPAAAKISPRAVSYTHLTLPTNREV